ncbi:TolC family protein [bacterium]|nr:TolC family protein [bacterium]
MQPASPMLSLALLILSLSPAGCVTLAPIEAYRPVALSADVDAPSASQAVSATSSPGSQPMRLEEAVALALENNPELAAAEYDTEAARARRDAAAGARLPELSAAGAYTRHLDDVRLVQARYNGEPGLFTVSIFSGDLILRVPLYTGGRLINEARAAELLSQSARHRMARTRDELIFNVRSIFYGILAQERLIESLRFSREALTGHLSRINALIEAQKAARVDSLRTEVRLADVEQKRVREENTLAVQHRVLANLMGIEAAGGGFTIEGELDAATTPAPALEAALTTALANRPDYLAARRELEAQARRVDIARAGHAPTVSLFGSYGGRWAAGESERPAGSDDSEDVGQIGVGVEIPLYSGGRIQARVNEERARLGAAQQRLRKLQLQVRLDVETALANLASAQERARTLSTSIDQARESLRIEEEKYAVGKGAIVDVLDAQAALLESQTSYYQALADLSVARAQVELAMGVQAE